MIQRNRGNAAYFRRAENVCGVISAAQSDLDHRKVHMHLCKRVKAHGSDQLKFVDRFISEFLKRFFFRHYRIIAGNQHFFRNAVAVNLDPFSEIHQIRRGKQSHMVSGRSEDRFCKGTHASLSIGSCHMDAAKLILRISQPFHQPCHALQRCHG